MPVKIIVCVGSSCHIRGSRAMLERFVEILKKRNIDSSVSMAGCFCMELCGEGMNWKFNDEEITSTSVEEAEKTLQEKLTEAVETT